MPRGEGPYRTTGPVVEDASVNDRGPADPPAPDGTDAVVFGLDGLDRLVAALWERGYRVMGPTVRDAAIVLDDLPTAGDLPIGCGDEQAPGHYRLRSRGDEARFGFAVGPNGPRRELSPPTVSLVTIRRTADGFDAHAVDPTPPSPLAFIGVRGCELAAMGVHDRVMIGGAHPDPVQSALGAGRFVVAVDCGDPASTCFCTSMGTGPTAGGEATSRADDIADLRLCELIDAERHEFLCHIGTAAGADLVATIPHRAAGGGDRDAATAVRDRAVERIERHLDTAGLAERLSAVPDHPRWDDVADRCLSCTNCTLVCPTCFCSSIADIGDLAGVDTTRTRTWDSCFSLDHSYLHGGSVHATTRSRYRQWLTHKLSTWWDQFGESGCVGCGRCLTWCPAGIDLVAEATALALDPPVGPGTGTEAAR